MNVKTKIRWKLWSKTLPEAPRIRKLQETGKRKTGSLEDPAPGKEEATRNALTCSPPCLETTEQ